MNPYEEKRQKDLMDMQAKHYQTISYDDFVFWQIKVWPSHKNLNWRLGQSFVNHFSISWDGDLFHANDPSVIYDIIAAKYLKHPN